MRVRSGLAFLEKTSDRRTLNLASFHSPHSLTWRWLLSLSLGWSERPFRLVWLWHDRGFCIGLSGLLVVWVARVNDGWQWGLTLLAFHLQYQSQAPIWYRDLYIKLRDERDGLGAKREAQP